MKQEVLDRELKSMLIQMAAGAIMGIGLFSFVYGSMLFAKWLIEY